MNYRRLLLGLIALAFAPASARPEGPPGDIRELKLRDWEPKSMMVTKATKVESAEVPGHRRPQSPGRRQGAAHARRRRPLPGRDGRGGRQAVVNLDGGWGTGSRRRSRPSTRPIPAVSSRSPSSTSTASTTPTGAIARPSDWRRASWRGAKGLKFHKTLGLGYRYKDGRLMPVDDPKLDPIWEMCARYGRPVVIHVGRPGRVLHPAGPPQRTLARAELEPRLAVLRRRIPQAPGTTGPAPSRDRQAPEDHLHQHPLRQQRRGPGVRRGKAGPISQHVRGHRRPDLGTRAGSRIRPQVLPEVSGPDPLRHRHPAFAGFLSGLLPVPGDRRRVFRLLGEPPSPGFLEHLRDLPPRRGPGQGLPQERRADLLRAQPEAIPARGSCASAPRETSRSRATGPTPPGPVPPRFAWKRGPKQACRTRPA